MILNYSILKYSPSNGVNYRYYVKKQNNKWRIHRFEYNVTPRYHSNTRWNPVLKPTLSPSTSINWEFIKLKYPLLKKKTKMVK